MPCHSSADGAVHICRASVTGKTIHSGFCHDCKRRSWFIGTHAAWYGWDLTCLRCGRHWSDGEWMPLAFVPKSRQRSIESAKRNFRSAVVVPIEQVI